MEKLESIFKILPTPLKGKESVYQALKIGDVRVELIRSDLKPRPGEIYNNNENELVMLVSGYAEIEFIEDHKRETFSMKDGDFVNIPAHLKHRLVYSSQGARWLAIYYKAK